MSINSKAMSEKLYYVTDMFISKDRSMVMPRSTPYRETDLPKDIFDHPQYIQEVVAIESKIEDDSMVKTINLTEGQELFEKSVKEITIKPQNILVTPIQVATNQSELVNINTATVDELVAVKGIGLSTANRIVESRPITSKEQLGELLNSRLNPDKLPFSYEEA